jgi:uncharacterized membrane protein YbhN (UPF0104 family)
VRDAARTEPIDDRSKSDAVSPGRRLLGSLLAVPTPVVFVVAAVVAGYVLWRQGSLGEIGGSLRAVDPRSVVAVLAAYGLSILCLGLRWHALVRMVGGLPAWTVSTEVFLTSVVVNYAAPIGLAVPTRAALTVRDLRLSPGQSAAVVAWEAGLDIAALGAISLAWLAVGGAALLATIGVDGRIVAGIVIAIALGVVAASFLVRTGFGRRARAQVGRGLLFAREEPVFALLAAILTGGYWAVQSMVMAGLLALLGTRPTAPLLLGVMGLPILLGMLSPVPGGAGVREGLMAAAARLEGVAAGPVLLAAIAYRLALFVVTPIVWGGVRAWRALGEKS